MPSYLSASYLTSLWIYGNDGFFTTTVLTDYCFGLGGVVIGTTLGAYVFKRIPNRIFRYIVYAYIAISGVIILMTNRNGNTGDIQENLEAVDAYSEEWRCACDGTHWHA